MGTHEGEGGSFPAHAMPETEPRDVEPGVQDAENINIGYMHKGKGRSVDVGNTKGLRPPETFRATIHRLFLITARPHRPDVESRSSPRPLSARLL